MQFVGQRPQQASTPAKAQAPLLSMYRQPPDGDITLEEFERYALDRLRGKLCTHGANSSCPVAPAADGGAVPYTVLKKIEEARLRSKSDASMQVTAWILQPEQQQHPAPLAVTAHVVLSVLPMLKGHDS